MSFGQGMALSYSWKHKINTKSSTEAKLVGVDDSLGYILTLGLLFYGRTGV
jgi:outer membrane protein W